jgi:hypothetical protein
MTIPKDAKSLLEALNVKTLDEAKTKIKDKIKPWNEEVSELKQKAQALVTATELILTKLNAPDETTKFSALAQLLRAERLHKVMSGSNAYTLRVAATANGTTKIKKNIFVDAKVRHSAGADLTYQVFDKDGFIARANGLHCYIEYQSSSDVQQIVTGRKKDVKCELDTGSNNQSQTGASGGLH